MQFLIRRAVASAPRAAMAARTTKAVAAVSARQFTQAAARRAQSQTQPETPARVSNSLADIKDEHDLFGAGAPVGTMPTDLDQAVGVERLEILGKMDGVDVFDMKPLDASRLGTMEDPILVRSFGDEQYAGCTGFPVDSHITTWLTISRERPIERCPECGSVYKMDYVGPTEDAHHDDHGHDHHAAPEEPKTFADFVKPDYRWS